MKLIVISAIYNMQKWVAQNIDMLQRQTFTDFRCLLGDDLSTDNTCDIINKQIKDDSRFQLVIHQEKKFSMGNIATLIDMAQPDDEDVLVLIDGDDQLANETVLQKIVETYENTGCWMTYGSYGDTSGTIDDICSPYSAEDIQLNRFRQVKWRASHLKTFKYKLWKRIDPKDFTISEAEYKQAVRRMLLSGRFRTWYEWRKIKHTDLLNPSQQYIRRCDDKAMTYPMLEMAGDKAHFIQDLLYIYNINGAPLRYGSKRTTQRWYTRCIRHILKHKQPYQRLETQ